MRKIFSVVFALLYTTLSTGAPALLHYCGHEEAMHLSMGYHEHEAIEESILNRGIPECCHVEDEKPSCHVPESNSQENHHAQEDDNCCTSSSVDLDEAQFEQGPKLLLTLPASHSVHAQVLPSSNAASTLFIKYSVPINGPPLYLKYSKLILYS